jgi:cytochrome c peroxidase
LDERTDVVMENIRTAKEIALSHADVRDVVRHLEREWPAMVDESDKWQSSIDEALSGMKSFEKEMHTFATRYVRYIQIITLKTNKT